MGRIVDPSEAKLATGLAESITAVEAGLLNIACSVAEGAVRKYLGYDPIYEQRTEYYPTHDSGVAGRETLWEITPTMLYERQLAGASAEKLQLRHIPIRSVSDLRIDYDGRAGTRSGSFGSSTVKTEGIDFWPNYDMVDTDGVRVCNDGVLKSQGRWPNVVGSVKVVYYAGYKQKELRGQDSLIDASPIWAAALNEIQRQMIRMAAMKKKTAAGFSGPLTSENLGDYSYTTDATLLQRLVGGMDLLPESMDMLSSFVNLGWGLGG